MAEIEFDIIALNGYMRDVPADTRLETFAESFGAKAQELLNYDNDGLSLSKVAYQNLDAMLEWPVSKGYNIKGAIEFFSRGRIVFSRCVTEGVDTAGAFRQLLHDLEYTPAYELNDAQKRLWATLSEFRGPCQ